MTILSNHMSFTLKNSLFLRVCFQIHFRPNVSNKNYRAKNTRFALNPQMFRIKFAANIV